MVHFFPSSPRVINDPVLNILAWNIHGGLDWMLRDLEVLDLFSSYDIILLQETWLLEGEELVITYDTHGLGLFSEDLFFNVEYGHTRSKCLFLTGGRWFMPRR